MTAPLLEARRVAKTFGQVSALREADFDVHVGEVVALIGDNGAGKSTLVKILSGVVQPDAGEILSDGRPVTIDSPTTARALGLETVYQDLALAPHLDPSENMFLGREIMRSGLAGRLGFMDGPAMRSATVAAFDDLGARIPDLRAPVGTMSGGQRQSIAVARAVAWANRVIFLDEPTAALGVVQTRAVLDLVRRVRDRGIGVVLISHSMPQVMEVADRIQVLRLGARVATYRAVETSMEELVGAMTGAVTQSGRDPAGEPADREVP
jgi:simple sugar transport system ATP-binding protein